MMQAVIMSHHRMPRHRGGVGSGMTFAVKGLSHILR